METTKLTKIGMPSFLRLLDRRTRRGNALPRHPDRDLKRMHSIQ
jgi:hypothetical protein